MGKRGATRSRPKPTRTTEEAKKDMENLTRRLKLPHASWEVLPPERRLYAPSRPILAPMTTLPGYETPASFKGGVSRRDQLLNQIHQDITVLRNRLDRLKEKAERQGEDPTSYPEYVSTRQELGRLTSRLVTVPARGGRKLTRRRRTRKQ